MERDRREKNGAKCQREDEGQWIGRCSIVETVFSVAQSLEQGKSVRRKEQIKGTVMD